MSDMDAVTAAKSDQINADDLVGTEMRVTVESVIIRAGTEQPVTVKLVGHDKVFRPCKTVARIMKAAWGADSSAYKGRSMLLYRDDSVTWGGMKVGGIRVRAISDITAPLVLALQEKKGSKKMTTVQPLKIAASTSDEPVDDPAFKFANAYIRKVVACASLDELAQYEAEKAPRVAELAVKRPDQAKRAKDAVTARFAALESLAREGRNDDDHGDGFDGGEA